MRRILAAVVCASWLLLPVEAKAPKKYAALTFDDGPSGKYTQALLDGLYDRGVKATFLLCGYRMEQYPDITRRIFEEGHEIGCHGFSHKNMKDMTRRGVAGEITDMEALLPEGCPVKFLRPPGGAVSDGVRQVAKARDLAILSWSVDPKDWATHDVSAIEKRVLTHLEDGDIILLHDMTESSVKAALDIVDAMLDQGFELVTVSQLAKIRGAHLQPGETYCKFPPAAGPPASALRTQVVHQHQWGSLGNPVLSFEETLPPGCESIVEKLTKKR